MMYWTYIRLVLRRSSVVFRSIQGKNVLLYFTFPQPLNSHSVNAIPGDKMSEEYEVKDIKDEVQKEYSENSLKRLAERYHKDVGESDQNILEELDQLNDIIGERTLHLNIF
ncbi:hypothetical protein AK88_02158 [Plasmodium fragile]|uniref:Uncharacterized protein n=1 Tax=Plasmodium fragile TaxID=5857 RepID=A0A0D9QRB0_PLAFR|nr:uncharacterized protein AK88_02158 [Plasmodium fragile]KJP88211.1 hypothetical protein AK88_02158 [Plasmodium fragile]